MHGWHTYCASDFHDAISYGTPTTIATCYPPEMAIQYAGTQITKVGIFSDNLYNYVGGLYTCSVYLGGETPAGGTIAYTMTVNVPQGLGDWAEFDLTTPVGVTGDETIWIVWECTEPLTPFPMGVCSDIDPSGNGIWAWNGSQWEQLWLSTGDWTVKTYFNWDEPQTQIQDVFYAGNSNGIGQIWKNDSLVQSINDTLPVNLSALQVTPDRTLYVAGYVHDTDYTFVQGRVWMNDSILFNAGDNTDITAFELNDSLWTAAGIAENEWEIPAGLVWQNGDTLYAYSDSVVSNQIFALTIDTLTGDVYAGGSSGELESKATVWKNDTILWREDSISSIYGIAHDGISLFAAGSLLSDSLCWATLWQNDSVVFSISGNDSEFTAISIFDSTIYLGGYNGDTLFIWQDEEVLFSHPYTETSKITSLVVNETGVYYAGQFEGIGTVWKDGEVLYQPDGCDCVNAICVQPAPIPQQYTLTVETDHPDWGTVSGGGSYYYGDTIQIEALPNIGNEFLYWNDSITDNPRHIVVTQDSTFVASFGRLQYSITVESNHPEWGVVSGGGTYYYGDTIEIAATPNLGHLFMGWEDGNVDNPREIVVTENHTYTALFEVQTCVITTEVTPEGAGTVTGGGTYSYGSIVTLTVETNTGYEFLRWSDGFTNNPRTIIAEGDATYTAVFRAFQYEITTGVDPVEGGTVTGGGTYGYGSTATLTAIPNEGYIFLFWNDHVGTNPRNITVTGNASYTATFMHTTTTTYTVTVLANDPLLGEVSGEGEYPEGTVVEINATPAPQAYFKAWDDGNTDNPRNIVVTQDLTYTALFEKIPQTYYNITVISDNLLLGSVSGGGSFPANTTTLIEAIPSPSSYFIGWQDGNTDNPRSILVTGDATYTAYFDIAPVQSFTISIQCDPEQGYVLGAGSYVANSIATLAAIANDNYTFLKWGDGITDNPRQILVDHDITLSVFFKPAGVDENEGGNFRLYPNPVNDEIHIDGLDGENEICIYNTLGVCVKTLTIEGSEGVSVTDMAAGLYLIRINGRQTVRFVKR